MKLLLAIASLMAVSMPVEAETIHLLIKSRFWGGSKGASGLELISIPMNSIDECEEQGAYLISSKRFELGDTQDVFECIKGK